MTNQRRGTNDESRGVSLIVGNSSFLRAPTLDIRHSPLGVGVFLLLAGMGRVLNEGRDPVQLLLETGNKPGRPVFKQDDEAEGKKYKQENPEQSSNETHARTLTYSLSAVNDLVRNIRQRLPLMLR